MGINLPCRRRAAVTPEPHLATFTWEGRRLGYEDIGTGDQPLVMLHGLLLDARSNRGTAAHMAAAGHRVVSLDLLGHGRSDHPAHASEYRMDVYAEQVVALLDHLGVPDAVLMGTSLGANVSLLAATRHPDRVRGLVLEMPVLEWAVPSAALTFAPMLLAVHYAAPLVRFVGKLARSIPEGNDLVHALLGPVIADPEVTAAVLHGILVGPVAPTIDERRALTVPTLVIGHRADPIHPFSDAAKVVEVMPDAHLLMARTPLELRLHPDRLLAEVERFLDHCWAPRRPARPRRTASQRAAG